MIKGYCDFYYNVRNMDDSVKFFESALGLKKQHGDVYWTTMVLGNLQLGLHWTEGEEIPPTIRDEHGQLSGGTLTLFSDNISEDRFKIENSGGKILGEDDAPWGHMLVFEDIDGNVLKLMNPK